MCCWKIRKKIIRKTVVDIVTIQWLATKRLECDGGCVDGWKWPLCNIECEDGTYGTNCSSNCGHCYQGQSCDKKTGACLHGCGPGYDGMDCNKTCAPPNYGPNCKWTCSSNCLNQTCDSMNGSCIMWLLLFPCWKEGKVNGIRGYRYLNRNHKHGPRMKTPMTFSLIWTKTISLLKVYH